jgi:hypothetical protein
MSRDHGDHGDSSFPRLLNYPISKYLESPLCSFVSFVVKAFDLPIAAMTRDDGDHGDSSFPRLLNYPISKYLESPLCSFVSFVVKAFDLPIAAMTCDDGDHGDSSFPRLLNYQISKYPPSPIPIIPIWRTLHPTRCSCGTAPGPPTGPGLACWGGGAPGCG